jgi:hypothetical protein
MTNRLTDTVNILVPAGALGSGVSQSDVDAGLAARAHGIALDAGSTDSGPAYLATGKSKYGRDAVKTDLRILMIAQAHAGIPLLIGSCGTSGCDMAVDWTLEIAREIAREEGLSPRVALLYSEQSSSDIAARARAGEVAPLAPMVDSNPVLFESCDRIVALMGPEPYIAALEAGADIVLGGRTTDTAVLAALPIMRGAGVGPAWHAGKTAECGGQCTVNPRDGSVMIRIGVDAFEVEPLSPSNACSPHTVSAHMLYENSDPFRLTEPGGILDVEDARYDAVDDQVVRVTGSRFEAAPYTMKLEGASGGAFQTIMLVGIQDPAVLRSIDRFLRDMHAYMMARVHQAMGDRAGVFDISLRPYGWNAVSGVAVVAGTALPPEIGLLFVATARTQELATQIAKTCNPIFFHYPVDPKVELPSYAFPFSPAEIERGQAYEFKLNHVIAVERPDQLVRTVIMNLSETARA